MAMENPRRSLRLERYLSVAQTLDQPIGRRQQGRQAHQDAINEVHSMWTPVRICD